MGIFSAIIQMIQGSPRSGGFSQSNDPQEEIKRARRAKEAGCIVKVTGVGDKPAMLYHNVVTALKLSGREHIAMEWIKDPTRIAAMSYELNSPNLVINGKTAAYSEVLDVDTLKNMFERLLPEKSNDDDEEIIELN